MPLLTSSEIFEFLKKCSVKDLETKIAANEFPSMVEINLFSKFIDDVSPLVIAVETSSTEIISKMLSNGFSCKIASKKFAIDTLMCAVHRHDQTERIKVVNLLIENGADIVAFYRGLFKFMLHPELHDKMVVHVKSLFEKLKTCEKVYAERFNAIRTLISEDVFSNLSQEQSDRLKKQMPEEFYREMTLEMNSEFDNQMPLAIQDPKKLLALPRASSLLTPTQKYLDAMISLHSIPPDYDTAHKLFSQLEVNSTFLRGFLEYAQGYCFQYSKGKPKNFKRAVALYEAAMNAKDTHSKNEINNACLKQLEEMALAFHIPDFDLAAVLYANKQIALNNFESAAACVEPILMQETFKNLSLERQNAIRYLAAKCSFHLAFFEKADAQISNDASFNPEKLYEDVCRSLEVLRAQDKMNLVVLQRIQALSQLASFKKLDIKIQNKFNLLAANCAFSLGDSKTAYAFIAPCENAQQSEFYKIAFVEAENLRKEKKLVEAEVKFKLLADRDYGPANFVLAWYEIYARTEGSNYLAAIEHYRKAATSSLNNDKFLEAKTALEKIAQDPEQTTEHQNAALDAFLMVSLANAEQHPPGLISNNLLAMKETRLDDAIMWAEKFTDVDSEDITLPLHLVNFYSEKAAKLQKQGQALASLEFYQKAALVSAEQYCFETIEKILNTFTSGDIKNKAELTAVSILLMKLAAGAKGAEILKIHDKLEKAGCVEAAAIKAICLENQMIKPSLFYTFSAKMQAQAIFTEALMKKPESFVLQLAYFNFLVKLAKPDLKQQLFAAASVLATQELKLDPDYQDDVSKARELLVKFTAHSELKMLASLLLSFVEQKISNNKPVNLAALTDTALRGKCEMEIVKTMTLPKSIRDLASGVQTPVLKSAPKVEASTNSGLSPVTPQQSASISRAVVEGAVNQGLFAPELPAMPSAPVHEPVNSSQAKKKDELQAECGI